MTKNWGRWGDTDEIGTLNLLSEQTVLRCVTEYVRRGRVIPLAIPLSARDSPNFPPRGAPVHLMAVDGAAYTAGAKAAAGCEMADDWIFMPSQSGTHLDALAHVWDEAKLYNGHSRDEIRSTSGARRCGISTVPPIVGRGVLVDIAGHRGVDRLPGDTRIGADEVTAVLDASGQTLEPGDIVLLRTGWMSMWKEDQNTFREFCPGIDRTAAELFADRDVALIGADNQSVEAVPWDAVGTRRAAPVHLQLMRDAGIHLMEMMNLEQLATEVDGPFLFIANPLPIKGAVGSPVTPIAIL